MANHSISLLIDSPTSKPAMSQETKDDGSIEFICGSCPARYKQLKRLTTHLKTKHGVDANLDETEICEDKFSPIAISTIEDTVTSVANGSPKGEPVKDRKRKQRCNSEEEDKEEDLESYLKEKEKRAKIMGELEDKFENDIGDDTMLTSL